MGSGDSLTPVALPVAILLGTSPFFQRLKDSIFKLNSAREKAACGDWSCEWIDTKTFGIDSNLGFGAHDFSSGLLYAAPIDDPDPRAMVRAIILGQHVEFRVDSHLHHQAVNALAALGACRCIGVDVVLAGRELSGFKPAEGRGALLSYSFQGQTVLLLDESYNANPLSMGAALVALSKTASSQPVRSGLTGVTRIAVLGDMRELGDASDRLHRELKAPVEAARIDKVFACGPFMKVLFDSLPTETRGAYAEKSESLIAPLLAAIQPGDVIMIKGSLGTRMAPIVEAVKKHLTAWEKTGTKPEIPSSS